MFDEEPTLLEQPPVYIEKEESPLVYTEDQLPDVRPTGGGGSRFNEVHDAAAFSSSPEEQRRLPSSSFAFPTEAPPKGGMLRGQFVPANQQVPFRRLPEHSFVEPNSSESSVAVAASSEDNEGHKASPKQPATPLRNVVVEEDGILYLRKMAQASKEQGAPPLSLMEGLGHGDHHEKEKDGLLWRHQLGTTLKPLINKEKKIRFEMVAMAPPIEVATRPKTLMRLVDEVPYTPATEPSTFSSQSEVPPVIEKVPPGVYYRAPLTKELSHDQEKGSTHIEKVPPGVFYKPPTKEFNGDLNKGAPAASEEEPPRVYYKPLTTEAPTRDQKPKGYQKPTNPYERPMGYQKPENPYKGTDIIQLHDPANVSSSAHQPSHIKGEFFSSPSKQHSGVYYKPIKSDMYTTSAYYYKPVEPTRAPEPPTTNGYLVPADDYTRPSAPLIHSNQRPFNPQPSLGERFKDHPLSHLEKDIDGVELDPFPSFEDDTDEDPESKEFFKNEFTRPIEVKFMRGSFQSSFMDVAMTTPHPLVFGFKPVTSSSDSDHHHFRTAYQAGGDPSRPVRFPGLKK